MQFTKFITILSIAATALAAPSVELYEKRSGSTPASSSISCAQGQGQLSCCEQKPVQKPVSQLGSNFTPTLGGILGVAANLLPMIVPTVSVAAQCVGGIAQVQACNSPNICCMAPQSGNTNSNNAGLINLLSNNQIAFCPGVTV